MTDDEILAMAAAVNKRRAAEKRAAMKPPPRTFLCDPIHIEASFDAGSMVPVIYIGSSLLTIESGEQAREVIEAIKSAARYKGWDIGDDWPAEDDPWAAEGRDG